MELSLIIKSLIILTVCLICSIQDIKTRKVSNVIIFTSCSVMLIYNAIFARSVFLSTLLSALLIFLIFFLGKLIMKEKLGSADVYFSIFIGLSLNYLYALSAILISIITCTIFILIYNLIFKLRKSKKQSTKLKVPFIPFMSAGLTTSYLISLFVV